MKMLRWTSLALVLAAGMLATTSSHAADDDKKADTADDLGTFQVGPSRRMQLQLDDDSDSSSEARPSSGLKPKSFKLKMKALRPRMRHPSRDGSGGASPPSVEQPVVLKAPAPKYPDGALKNRLEGYVDIEYTIDTDGDTDDINVLDAKPEGVFNLAARRAVASWRFKPYRVNGEAQPKRVKQRIKFDLPAGLGAVPNAGGAGKSAATPDRGPVAEYTPAPAYPSRAAQRRIEGYVVVQYTVTASGETDDISVVESRPAHMFDRAATRAVSRWRFKPALQNGEAVPRTVKQRIDFSRH